MGPKYLNKFLLSILIFSIIMSCDPCDDCDSVVFEPRITLVFINQDSLNSLNDSLAVFAFNDSALSANIDSLGILRDSLQIINDSIENGGNLDSQKMDVEEWISERQSDSTLFATKNQDADSLTTVFNSTKSTINSGLMQVNQIEIVGTTFIETYEDVDSATSWSIPLSYDKSFTEYEVSIANFTDIIELDYDIFQEVDNERNVLLRAENIRVVERDYQEINSIETNCEENCIDGETVFTIYF